MVQGLTFLWVLLDVIVGKLGRRQRGLLLLLHVIKLNYKTIAEMEFLLLDEEQRVTMQIN